MESGCDPKPLSCFQGYRRRIELVFRSFLFVDPVDQQITATTTSYGIPFTSSIWKDNVVACQFHPEKSQAVGLQLIRNFGDGSERSAAAISHGASGYCHGTCGDGCGL